MDFFSGLLERSTIPARGLQRRRPSRFEPLPRTLHSGPDNERENEADTQPREPTEHQAASTPGGTGTSMRREAVIAVGHSEPVTRDGGSRAHTPALPSISAEKHSDRVDHELVRLAQAVEQLGRSNGKGGRSDTESRGQQYSPRHSPNSRPLDRPAPGSANPGHEGETAIDRRQPALSSKDGVRPRTPSFAATVRESVIARRPTSVVEAHVPTPPVAAPTVTMSKSRDPIPARHGSGAEPSPEPTGAAHPVLHLLQPLPSAPRPATIAGRHAAASSAAPEQTTVHVSIGRIEIRAVPTTEKNHRTAQATGPRLSLDEYLKARNGGPR